MISLKLVCINACLFEWVFGCTCCLFFFFELKNKNKRWTWVVFPVFRARSQIFIWKFSHFCCVFIYHSQSLWPYNQLYMVFAIYPLTLFDILALGFNCCYSWILAFIYFGSYFFFLLNRAFKDVFEHVSYFVVVAAVAAVLVCRSMRLCRKRVIRLIFTSHNSETHVRTLCLSFRAVRFSMFLKLIPLHLSSPPQFYISLFKLSFISECEFI